MSIAPSSLHRFLQTGIINEWFPGNPQQVFWCQFDIRYYNDFLFEQTGIARPSCLEGAVTKRKAEFLAGRYSARQSLAALGVHDATVGVGRHRNPVWPQRIVGSISHCDNVAVAVAYSDAYTTGVGIDIEAIITRETMKAIGAQIANDLEFALISKDVSADENLLLFTLLFSAKESFFKAAYPTVGEYFGFDAVSLVGVDKGASTLWLQTNEILNKHLPPKTLIKSPYHILSRNKVATFVKLFSS